MLWPSNGQIISIFIKSTTMAMARSAIASLLKSFLVIQFAVSFYASSSRYSNKCSTYFNFTRKSLVAYLRFKESDAAKVTTVKIVIIKNITTNCIFKI